jgi:CubicO group peptidase (beta-lactamase class C family)
LNPGHFDQDLARIRDELRDPNLSAVIVESGHIVWHNDSSTTMYPIASVTTTMTAVLVMQLVEQGRLSLNDPIGDVTIRQVLSHTADGTPGEEYLYNSDIFNSLTSIVEKAGGKPFPELLTTRIFRPLHMSRTTASPSTRAGNGVVSTTGDLAKYAIALDGDRLVSAKSKAAMFTPTKSTRGKTLPYALGWFSQTYLNERVIWHYGQETRFGSLFLQVPDRRLTLIVLADSNVISDAARLLDGNVARSPIALAFFKEVAFSNQGAGAFERDELENRALIAFHFRRRDESVALIKEALAKFPEMESSDDLTLLGLLAQLHLPETQSIATAVLREHPSLPPAWFYYGVYLLSARRYREATATFQRITDHQPPWHHWSVQSAREELKRLQ